MKRKDLISSLAEDMQGMGRLMHTKHWQAASKKAPTHAQIGMLFMLAHHGSQNAKQLSQCFHMTPSAATQLVDSLVKDRLVTRKEDKQDRRKISIELTTAGKAIIEQARKQRLEVLTRMLEPLSDKELIQFSELQKKILHHLNNVWHNQNKQ